MKIGKYIIHHYYVNNCISSMMRGIADFFQNEIFQNSNEIIISTYEKGVQHYLQRLKDNTERFNLKTPFIVFDPGVDFEPDPQFGRFLYKFPSFYNGHIKFGEVPIYKDENIILSIMTNWFKGTFDVYVWCGSVRELMDMKMLSLNVFGGHGRYISPNDIKGYVVLPDEILAYNYLNEYTGESYSIDWTSQNIEIKTIKNIGMNKYVYVFDLKPWIRFVDSPEASSDKYGGGDEVSSYRLDIRCEWECNIPTYFVLKWKEEPESYYKRDSIFKDERARIVLDTEVSYEYFSADYWSKDGYTLFPEYKTLASIGESVDDTSMKRKEEELVLKDVLLYTITDLDMNVFTSNNKVDIIIYLDRDIDDFYKLDVRCKYGKLVLSKHWLPVTKNSIKLITLNCPFLKEGLNIWIGIYEIKNN